MTDQQIDNLFTFQDKHGNQFNCINRRLFLILENEPTGKQRRIGKIVHDNGTLVYSKHEDEKDIFQKTNAWSIPYEIVERVHRVTYHTKKKVYRINTQTVKEIGKFFHFKKSSSSIELKIYVPLSKWDVEDRKQERMEFA